jgi:hypothetical protein
LRGIFFYYIFAEENLNKVIMKVKLLKKIRERYSIEYCPKGFILGDDIYNSPYVVIVDKRYKGYIDTFRVTNNIEEVRLFTWNKPFFLEDAKEMAYKRLVQHIKSQYAKHGTRRIKAQKIAKKEEAIKRAEERVRLELEQKLSVQKLWYK